MDTATAKALLQSTDIVKLQEAAEQVAGQRTDDHGQEVQLLKLQLLLWNRILQLQKASNASDADQAVTFQSSGSVWMRMGDNDRAIGQLKKALELQPTGPAAVKVEQLLGQVYINSSEYEQAAEHYQKAIAELVEQDGAQQDELALAYGQLAAVYEAQSDFPTAQDWLAKAVEACERIDDAASKSSAVATIQSQRGTLHEKLGEYNKAVEALGVAVKALEESRGKDDSRTKEIAYLLEIATGLAADE